MRDFNEERDYEDQQDADGEAAYDYYYNEVGPQWARDHARELAQEYYEENYEQAVKEFTSERLQSYYVANPNLAVPAIEALRCAHSLMPSFPQAALVFAVTATELAVKTALLKPIVFGLVHAEGLASFITDLATQHTGVDRFQILLTKTLAECGGVELETFKRANSAKTLWREIDEVQRARNAVIHRGEMANKTKADLAISVAGTLLTEIFPQVLAKLGLHLDDSTTVCARTYPKTT